MKLHLPKQLFSALIATIACLQLTEAAGTIYTLTAQQSGNPVTEMAHATYTETTQNKDGTYSLTSTTASGWGDGYGPAANVVSKQNVLRFAEGDGIVVGNKGLTYTFSNWNIGGLIVESSSYSISASGGSRQFTMSDGTYIIDEDFCINTSAATETGKVTMSGTQVWEIGSQKTMTINSGAYETKIESDASITYSGTGIAKFDGALSNNGNVTVENGGLYITSSFVNNGNVTVENGAEMISGLLFANK